MEERRVFKNAANGTCTLYDLYNTYSGHNQLYFNHLAVKKEPGREIWICIYQFRDGLIKELEKLRFVNFKRQYVDECKTLHFDPMSKVFMALEVECENGLVMLADEHRINFSERKNTGKLEYSEIGDFEFELSYELEIKEHEPVYL